MTKTNGTTNTTAAPPWETTFAAEFLRRREALGLSQSEVARRAKAKGLNIWQSAIGRIETGERQVTLNEALTLAAVVEADPMQMAAYHSAEQDEIDLALRSMMTALNVAQTSLETIANAVHRMEDAEQTARAWLDKALAASDDMADDDQGIRDTLDALKRAHVDLADVLEKHNAIADYALAHDGMD